MPTNQNGTDTPELNQTAQTPETNPDHLAPLKQITPLSKYLAMALFIILPFVGAYLGYTYAPGKVVEVDSTISKELGAEKNENTFSKVSTSYINSEYGFQFDVPAGWLILSESKEEVLLLPQDADFRGKYISVEIGPDYVTPYCFEQVDMFSLNLPEGWSADKFVGDGNSGCTPEGVDFEDDPRHVAILTDIEASERIVWQINTTYASEQEDQFEIALRQIVNSFTTNEKMTPRADLCAKDSAEVRAESGADFVLQSNSTTWENQYDILLKSAGRKALCRYNPRSGEYELFVSLDNVDDELFPLDIISLPGEFPIEKYIHLTSSYHEGLQYAPLLRLAVDTNEPQIEETGFMTPNHPSFALNSSRRKLVLFPEDHRHQLYVYDVQTGDSALLHEINPSEYTYFNAIGYGEPSYRVEWEDEDIVTIRAVALDKNELVGSDFAHSGSESKYSELQRGSDYIEVTINTSELDFK